MRKIRSYVLRGGRLSEEKKRIIEKYSDIYCIPYNEKALFLNEIFKNDNPVIIEIGFGMGDAAAEIAEKFPEINFIGIEVFTPGVGKLLSEIVQKKLENIRIIQHDAVEVLNHMIKADSIDGFHIFFPDPWPKKKHAKRRLIQESFIKEIDPKCKRNGYIYCVTDWKDYAEQIEKVFSSFPHFIKENEKKGSSAVSWRPVTKFEIKGLEKNHSIYEFFYRKQ